MNRSFRLFMLLLPAFSACNSDRVQNTRELALEMNDRKIKRVTDAQLVSTADEWGKALVITARKSLTNELAKTPGGPATPLCRLEGLPVIQKLEKQYAVSIDLLSTEEMKNPALNPKERELLDAYRYNAERKLEQSDNVQKIADTLFVYNAPVPTDDPICRTCADSAALPLVIWRVVFNKREIIRRINPRKLR
ncbi:hypothetical protein [Larkinella soli]|uniref:hypothetical protein n=1 Tax=Larkinella soli TaxID=1770527 RepID=UPI000FFB48B6|nr:hypothetical protein [Larkinella soli]